MAAKKKTSSSDKALEKARTDARKRATKSGTPVGKTTSSIDEKKMGSRAVRSQTTVKSARGNMYTVFEDKVQRKFRPDTIRKEYSYVLPASSSKKAAPKKK